MADKKISQLTAATTPLAGTEVLPIVQSGSTVKVSAADITAGRSVKMDSLGLGGSNPVSYAAIEWAPSAAVTYGVELTPLLNADTTNVQLVRARPRATTNTHTNVTAVYAGLDGLAAGSTTTTAYGLRVTNPTGTVTNCYGVHSAVASGVGQYHIYLSTDANSYTAGNWQFASGKGIDFSANTHAAGMTSELLNWYETGTWTPTLTCSDGNFDSVTYDPLRGGRYTRVGNMVHVQCYMRTDAVDNTVGRSGDVLIAGLPFAAVTATSGTLDGHSSLAVSVASAWTGEEPLAAFISGGDTNIQLLYRSAVDGSTSNIVAADVNTGANANIVLIAGTYICA